MRLMAAMVPVGGVMDGGDGSSRRRDGWWYGDGCSLGGCPRVDASVEGFCRGLGGWSDGDGCCMDGGDGSIGAGRASFIVSTDGAGRASLIASTDGAGRASFVASTDGAGPQSGGRTVAGRVGPGPLGKP